MAEKKIRTRKHHSDSGSQRLTGIEQSIGEMENRMNETKQSIHKIEGMLKELSHPKKRAAIHKQATSQAERPHRPRRSLFSLFTGKHQEEPRKSSLLASLTGGGFKASDLTTIAELLQNPAVQSLLKNNSPAKSNSRKKGAKKNRKTKGNNPITGALGNMDMAQIMTLLQNPAVQAMLKNIL
ncbi:hypothetical protein DFP93_11214 [Aneurinibacillus soli]|uniref:Uncharacterized protein n=1 Tax=Aneurinibacillus soli TaxID=1500254 RepID=A0A0U5BNV6_9BACL|nr:hypothetical protein [Aneurinibacillus soli]PYE60576.1 hypothetical protein DFP93_11214 [Aneurinibacillus soli]BAU29902.1 hypothetical protein CB4_04156 [Aneurinibacillus soli]